AAHEIRGPITSMHLAVQLLREEMVPKDKRSKTYDMIEREDRRLAQFVDELLDLSRIRAGTLRFEFEQVELGSLVRDVTNRLAPELARQGSSIAITVDHPISGEWDRFRLEQVVTNLVANAIKFGLGKPIEVRVTARDNLAVLAVADHGIGI